MERRKIAVFFPGNFYSVHAPLFYYADLILASKGYKVVELSYDHVSEGEDDWIDNTRNAFLSRLQEMDIQNDDEVVFVSKSIGTVIAGWISERLPIRVRSVFFSPLKGAIPFMKASDCLVFAGTKDRLMSPDELSAACREKEVDLSLFEGAGHAIVNRADPLDSVRILGEIVRKMEEFIPD